MSTSLHSFYEFPLEEYNLRYKRARDLMKEHRIDALLVSDPVNYRYFTGHSPRTDNRPAFFFLPIDEGNEFVIASEDLGSRDAKMMTYVKNIREYPLPFHIETIKDFIQELGYSKKRVGIELNDTFFSAFRPQLQFEQLNLMLEQLPELQLVNSALLIWQLRMIKSKAEIACIKKACDITSKAYKETFDNIYEGLTERKIAELLVINMLRAGADCPSLGKYGPSAPVIIDASRPAEEVHSPTEKKLCKGDLLHIDGGAIYNGYYSDFTRSAVVGRPSVYQRENWDRIVKRVKSAFEVIKPGNPLGIIPVHWHSVGMYFVEAPFGGIKNRGVHGEITMKPGMVLCLEDIFSGEAGETYAYEDDLLITETGYEILSLIDSTLRII